MLVHKRLETRIREHLAFLYGVDQAGAVWKDLETILHDFQRRSRNLAPVASTGQLTERDAILITYGDQFQEPGQPPLQTLHQVLTQTLDNPTSGVHILPFYPYSSDDGFSVSVGVSKKN